MKEMMKRILRVAGASLLGFVFFIALFITYRHNKPTEPKYTLREALWISDRDMTHYYPPLSKESLGIAMRLEEVMVDPHKKAYDEYVLYRMGLTTSDEPTEKVLIIGFKPPKN